MSSTEHHTDESKHGHGHDSAGVSPWVKRSGIAVGVVLAVVVIGVVSGAGYMARAYETRVLPGVHVGAIDLSGLSYMKALDAVEQKTNTLLEDGVMLVHEEQVFEIPAVLTPLDSAGEEITLYSIDPQATVDEAYALGHSGTLLSRLKSLVLAWRNEQRVAAAVLVQDENLQRHLDNSLSALETAAENAQIEVKGISDITVIPEKNGKMFADKKIAGRIAESLKALSSDPITIQLEDTAPAVTQTHIDANRQKITSFLEHAPLKLTYEDKSWEFSAEEMAPWIRFDETGVVVNAEEMHKSLTKKASGVEVDPVEGRWKVITNEEGKPTSLEPLREPVIGKKFDTKTAAEQATKKLRTETAPSVALHLTEYAPKFQVKDGALPIRDLLGTGHSNMTGSPANRQLNIRRGVELLNGLLIAPGEEFSLVNSLKPFTLENGYHAELVIKGNQTLPEIGGGLCQVGTTTFRATMNAGLDVTMRQNHSYAVSYYSDDRNGLPGTDATIYDPAPDFKFLNDTPGFILIQTRIDGQHLYFDFWGTSDGRKGSFSEPTISGWIAPPPTKLIETDTLAPGVKKCTETAHPGTTATFTYSVERSDGTMHKEDFVSKYKPWQAVCLVGKAKEEPKPAKAETKKDTAKKN